MQLLAGHTGEDATLKGDYQIRLGNAINRLPWDGEWRTYDHDALKRNSGLDLAPDRVHHEGTARERPAAATGRRDARGAHQGRALARRAPR